jgi:hypothetical protein
MGAIRPVTATGLEPVFTELAIYAVNRGLRVKNCRDWRMEVKMSYEPNEPGELFRGFTEYTVTCQVCEYQESDYHPTRRDAEKAFREGGWHKNDGKWRCDKCAARP